MRNYLRLAALLVVTLIAGCSSSPPPIVEAEGVVLLNGVPLPQANVRFFPQFDSAREYIAQGNTDENGHFVLTCHGQPGACAIENVITVTDEEIPTNLTPEGKRAELQAYLKTLKNRPIPTKYRNVSESPIKMTVSANKKDYKIELTR